MSDASRLTKIYLASPWFNDEQAEREDRIKRILRGMACFDVFSPKDNVVCPPDASDELRKKAFEDNVKNIEDCDILFAITDGKDMGTIWEAGYACGLNAQRLKDLSGKQIKIVYFCESLKGGLFNLMLAQSGDIVFTDAEALYNLPAYYGEGVTKKYDGKIE